MRMTAGQEVEKIETRLRQLGGKLERLAGLGSEMADDAHIEYRKQIVHTQDKFTVVRDNLQKFKNSGGQSWESFKGNIARAWRDFEQAFRAVRHGPSVPIPVQTEDVGKPED
jgi:hypothetical protein